MARPTTAIAHAVTPPAEERAATMDTLKGETSDSASALADGLALLRALHQQGILEALAALAQHGDDALGIVMELLTRDGSYVSGAKNAMVLAKTLATLDDTSVDATQRMLSSGLRAFASAKPPARSYGLLRLGQALKDPDVSAGLEAILALLKGIGAAQREQQREQQREHQAP